MQILRLVLQDDVFVARLLRIKRIGSTACSQTFCVSIEVVTTGALRATLFFSWALGRVLPLGIEFILNPRLEPPVSYVAVNLVNKHMGQ